MIIRGRDLFDQLSTSHLRTTCGLGLSVELLSPTSVEIGLVVQFLISSLFKVAKLGSSISKYSLMLLSAIRPLISSVSSRTLSRLKPVTSTDAWRKSSTLATQKLRVLLSTGTDKSSSAEQNYHETEGGEIRRFIL